MKRRSATKCLSLTATAAMIAAPLVIATASPAAAATTSELPACTSAALQKAITDGGSYDLAVCQGKTITSKSQAALVDNGSTVSLSYTGPASGTPTLKFSAIGTKGSLLQVNSGSVTLKGLVLAGVTLSVNPAVATEGGAIYVGSGGTLTLQDDTVAASFAIGAAGAKGADGASAGFAGGNGTGDGAAGFGGAIYNAGTTSIIGSLLSSDYAIGGAGGDGGDGIAGTTGTTGPDSTDPANPGVAGGAGGDGGGGGSGTDGANGEGGAIYNATGGILTINSTSFAANNALGGKGGNGGNGANGGNGGPGGAGADGTGSAGDGSAGGNGGAGGVAGSAGSAGVGGNAIGGAIFNGGTVYINASALSANVATGGAGGNGGNAADPGNGGAGGNGGNGTANSATSSLTPAAGGAGGPGGNGGAAGSTNGSSHGGGLGGNVEGAGIADFGTSQIASSTFTGDKATGGAGGKGGDAGQPNAGTPAKGGTGGTGAQGGAGTVAGGTGGNGGKGGNGGNGSGPATAGSGGIGGAANGLTISAGGSSMVGCLSNGDVATNLTGGAAGSGGAAGNGAPASTPGTGGAPGAGGTGGLSSGGSGTAGATGSTGTGGDAAPAGAAGTAGLSDAHLIDGTPGNLPCASFSPASITGSANLGSSVSKTLIITNTGSTSFTVSTVTTDNPTDVSVTGNTCSALTTAGATCTVTVSLTPDTAGATTSATLTIHDNGVGGAQSIPVAITGNQDASSLSNSVTSAKITAGRPTIIGTTVDDRATSTALSGKLIYLYGKPTTGTKYVLIGHATTNSSGKASLIVTPVHDTTYAWVYPGAGRNAAANSKTVAVSVVRTVTIKLQNPSIRNNSVAVVYGTTNPADSGVKVALQQFSHGKWHSAGANGVTKKQKLPDGSKQVGFVLRARASARGTYLLRVVCSATKTNLGSTSSKKTLLVS